MMKTVLKFIGILFLVLLFIIVSTVLTLPRLLSTDLVRNQVADLVEKETGHRLMIGGKTSFKFYPNIAISLDDITLSNPSGVDGPPLVTIASLRANLKLKPLFEGRTEIDSITLIKPGFNLLVDNKGQHNWNFKTDEDRHEGDEDHSENSTDKAFTLGIVTIKDGFVTYKNVAEKIDEKIEGINFTLTQNPSDRSMEAKGSLSRHKELVKFSSLIKTPDDLFISKSSTVKVEVNSSITTSRYDGILDLGKKPSIEGTLTSNTPSVRKLASFFDIQLPSGTGFGELKIDNMIITADANEMSFTADKVLFDKMNIGASGIIKLGSPRPNITLDIKTDRLDLNLYLDEQDTGSASGSSTGGTKTDTPVDLSGLKAFDGEFSLNTTKILYRKGRLGEGRFTLTVNKGRANASIDNLNLYRGTANGKFVLDGSGSKSSISGNLSVKDVLAGAVLRDLAGFDKLAGKGTLQSNFTSKGNSVTALKKSLKGKASLSLQNGRIEGFDLAQYVRDLTGNIVPGIDTGTNGKPMTAYDEMSGTWNINNGIASNKDFLLRGKFFRVRAAGTIDLVEESLRLRVAPNLFSGDWTFAPPLRVTGSLSKPKISLDALAFLSGQSVMRSIGGLMSGKKIDLGNVLKNRGLKTDTEIESYLAGNKIDTSHDEPVNDNQPDSGNTKGENASEGGDGGGNTESAPVNDLLKKVLP